MVKEAIDRVHDTYYREFDRKDLSDRAIAGIVSSLDDRFSNYFSPKEYSKFKLQQSGQFAGIGVQVAKDPAGLKIVKVYDNSPARRAKLQDGDVITAVDGKPAEGPQPGRLGRAHPGADRHAGRPHRPPRRRSRDVELTRSAIEVPVVASRGEDRRRAQARGHRLAQFSSGAHGEVAAALRKAMKDGAKGIVLDLRGNGGGLLTEARSIAASSSPTARSSRPTGARVPARTLSATGDAIDADAADRRARRPRHRLARRRSSPARCRTASAPRSSARTRSARASSRRSSSCSNGGALDITAGQYFLPSGPQHRRQGRRRRAAASRPTSRRSDDPETTRRDEALDAALARLAAEAR